MTLSVFATEPATNLRRLQRLKCRASFGSDFFDHLLRAVTFFCLKSARTCLEKVAFRHFSGLVVKGANFSCDITLFNLASKLHECTLSCVHGISLARCSQNHSLPGAHCRLDTRNMQNW